nr:MAG TPA: hypothetical protein [Caudoviricetes sp.]
MVYDFVRCAGFFRRGVNHIIVSGGAFAALLHGRDKAQSRVCDVDAEEDFVHIRLYHVRQRRHKGMCSQFRQLCQGRDYSLCASALRSEAKKPIKSLSCSSLRTWLQVVMMFCLPVSSAVRPLNGARMAYTSARWALSKIGIRAAIFASPNRITSASLRVPAGSTFFSSATSASSCTMLVTGSVISSATSSASSVPSCEKILIATPYLLTCIKAVKYHRHCVLRVNGNVAGQLYRELALAVFGRLQAKTAGGQRIFDLDCHATAVRTVAYPPQVCKVSLLQVAPGGDGVLLARACVADVSSTQRKLDGVCAQAQAGKGQLALPAVQMLQLLHVDGAVVHVLTQVAVCGNTSGVDAACGCADDVLVSGRSRRGGSKLFQQHTRIQLQPRKGILRDYGKFTHLITSIWA